MAVVWLSAAAGLGAGCSTSPLSRTTQDELREQMISANQAYLKALQGAPPTETTRKPGDMDAELTAERRAEIDSKYGSRSYVAGGAASNAGPALGRADETPSVQMTLQRAVTLAVKHNIELQQARMVPAITQTRVTQAEAVFDAVFFTNIGWQKTDTPLPLSPSSGFVTTNPALLGGPVQNETLQLTTGIRKDLASGARVTLQTEFSRIYDDPSRFVFDTYYTSNVSMNINQPLLRGFGADYTQSEILLARNARKQSVEDMRKLAMDVAQETERAYWDLVMSRHTLAVVTRSYERGKEDSEKIRKRGDFDASPVQRTQAASFVEIRRSNVIRAQTDVRRSSDILKRLINAPDLPLAGETLVVPLDEPADLPVTFNLLDSVTTGLRRRPELTKALSQIDDTAIRLKVAENGLLPVLNATATMRFNGMGRSVGDAYEKIPDGDFIDYILGGQFEMPLGNRAAEAALQQRKLERQAGILAYQKATQDVVLDVKNAQRELVAAYALVGSTRSARRAAADNLRALIAQEDAGGGLTPDFLDLKLTTQDRLANTEVQEIKAMTDYNTAVTRLYQAMGTLLDRNGIEFKSTPE